MARSTEYFHVSQSSASLTAFVEIIVLVRTILAKLGLSRRLSAKTNLPQTSVVFADYGSTIINQNFSIMYYETNCTSCGSIDKWNELMRGARKCSYKRLVARIKKELPELYDELCLNFYNPWEENCQQTKTHYILVHSGIEYFIHK